MHVGDTVRLKGSKHVAKVIHFTNFNPKKCRERQVTVHKKLRGFREWDESKLEVVRAP